MDGYSLPAYRELLSGVFLKTMTPDLARNIEAACAGCHQGPEPVPSGDVRLLQALAYRRHPRFQAYSRDPPCQVDALASGLPLATSGAISARIACASVVSLASPST